MLLKWYIVDIKMIFWNEKEGKRLSQELSFYDKFIEKPRVKHFKNIYLLHEFNFIEKISKAFGIYAKGSRIEIID